jgi:hypothetical protein
MRRALGSTVILLSLVIGVAVQAQDPPPPARGRAQAPPQNLQVLPKDMTRQQITPLMRSIAGALGVECTHCHVSLQNQAADDKPTKLVARNMIKMTMAINTDFLKDVGEPSAPGAQKVTCYTCHRGALKPLTAPPAGGVH